MILTHESGSQEDQFDDKKWRQKIPWDYPFNNPSCYLYMDHFDFGIIHRPLVWTWLFL